MTMRWSFRIGAVARINIRVHVTFLFVVLLGALGFQSPFGWAGVAFGVLFVMCLFACVTLHEVGHGLVARRFGVEVKEIVLLPIGGVARLSREPRMPLHELWIAVAGPGMNGLIAALLAVTAGLTVGPNALIDATIAPSLLGLLVLLFWANVALAAFNMLPVLPMDGGRALRALLSVFVGRVRGTEIAVTIAQITAVVATAYSVSKTPAGSSSQLVFIALGLFVMLAASQERLLVRTQETLRGLRAGEVCDPRAEVFAPGELLGPAIDHLLRSSQAHFAVMHGARLVGTLSRDDAIVAAEVGLDTYIGGIMRRDVAQADADTPLDELRLQLLDLEGAPIAIVNAEGFVGLVGLEDLSRVAAIATSLEKRGVTRSSARARNSASWL